MLSKEHKAVIFYAKFFVASICVLLVILGVRNSWQVRENQLAEAESTVSNLSRGLAQHATDTFKEADTALIGITERLEHDGRSPAALIRLERFLVRQVSELSQLSGLFAIDKDGHWIVNSDGMTGDHLSSLDREYFLYHRAHPGNLPHIDRPIKSRTTGDWIITISRRINAPDGSFDGLVMAAIKLDYFSYFYDSFDIGDAGILLLALDDGTMLVRQPLRKDSIGKSLVDTSIYRDYASKTSNGVARIRSSQDGVVRINSYRHLSRYPIFIVAALSEDEVLSRWKSETLLHLFGLLTLISIIVFFGNRLVVQIKLRVAAEQEANESRAYVEHLNLVLQALAMRDSLTGLANRRCFDDAISRELQRAARNKNSLALLMIDVDYFKKYNDTYGHPAGDACLKQIANAIRVAEKRSVDLVARYGGEEIIVMLPDCDAQGAVQIAENILSEVRALAIPHSGNPRGIVTVSAGVAVLNPIENNDIPETIIGMADKALYQAKSNGRDQVRLYIEDAAQVCQSREQSPVRQSES
ncbi:sensor domain-containing diguanylate cyclase [Herminiimonas fonticola]|uniref:diguanylate cyclase n=1 Tax=Herminiimonas fonticola TaxID=303380 RepID=A0A4R6G365_9BURK|nr:sensor domain-containing diguanylate cyclase [Herminiimonas fonticola]RBA23629.1 GGDEF: diguanylate cyclase (GGDEF) domain [Herminiimonas fonticola]TDN88035.1 diguanylate cyclase (GGDEF)-like protein [Herminiimonas fonticola]